MTKLTVLNVAYPLAPVRPDTAGGAEQILGQIDRALTAQGDSSIVIACEGSRIAGRLIGTPAQSDRLDSQAIADAQRATAAAVGQALCSFPIDLVHMHGIDFHAYLPPQGRPTLVTLHLPLAWYPVDALRPKRPDTFLHCVSRAQHRTAPISVSLLQPIENGVKASAHALPQCKRNFALFLGRICPEKGVHLAMEAAALAKLPLLIAGHVFGYAAHRKYFNEEIAPRLNGNCRFIGALDHRQKIRLLAKARCILVPSLAEETSSLVAREALATGTPVIAFPNGALTETIEDGRTGFLVSSIPEMAAAILDAGSIDPHICHAEARRRFPLEKMLKQYLELYRSLVGVGTELLPA